MCSPSPAAFYGGLMRLALDTRKAQVCMLGPKKVHLVLGALPLVLLLLLLLLLLLERLALMGHGALACTPR